jgi:hypothetical protein
MIELIQASPSLYRFNGVDVLNISKALPQDRSRIDEITEVLHSLGEKIAA